MEPNDNEKCFEQTNIFDSVNLLTLHGFGWPKHSSVNGDLGPPICRQVLKS